jgi:hypothetical protein
MIKFLLTTAMLIWFASYGQLKRDTIEIILLTSDTTVSETPDGILVYHEKVSYKYGYAVRELHNTAEGQLDAGACSGCWTNYWKPVQILNVEMRPFKKGLLIWQWQEVSHPSTIQK